MGWAVRTEAFCRGAKGLDATGREEVWTAQKGVGASFWTHPHIQEEKVRKVQME